MSQAPAIDGVLVEWGDRLFYPKNHIVRGRTPLLRSGDRAALIRGRIEATVRRAPQVMVKVTGGGRGMKAIAAHFRYISKNGRLDIEDDRGVVERGKDALHEIERQWQFGGSYIGAEGQRREAFNIMLSMPRGTNPTIVQKAARAFARSEFAEHRYVMVLHEHQANPHVHLSVKAESQSGVRLNPRKADLHRWREIFAEKLQELGIDAEASRQATRGEDRNAEALWHRMSKDAGRLQDDRLQRKTGRAALLSRQESLEAWKKIGLALTHSERLEDRLLARQIVDFLKETPMIKRADPARNVRRSSLEPRTEGPAGRVSQPIERVRKGPDLER